MSSPEDASKDEKKESIFEVLDQLIFHLNTTKNVFTLLIISSFILAPVALVTAGVILLHPAFMRLLLTRLPSVAAMVLVFVTITVILASVWLYIGLTERVFFSNWNKKFSRFMSLKDKIDKELGG